MNPSEQPKQPRKVQIIKADQKTAQEAPAYKLRRHLIALIDVLAELPPKEAKALIQSVVK